MALNLPKKEICEKYLSGMSTVKLGKECGCGSDTIGRLLQRMGVKLRSPGSPKSNLPKEICCEYLSGMTTVELGKKYGYSSTCVGNFLRKNDIELRQGMCKLDLPEVEICDKYLSSMTLNQLGKEYNCSSVTIWNLLRRNGIEIRSRSDLENLIIISCINQGIPREEFSGFVPESRPYLLPENQCVKLNERFPNAHFHHLTKSLGIYIPKELHLHYPHNIRTGLNMEEINMVALQFINGGL